MTDTRTNQPTTEQEPTLEQLMSRLEMARAMDFGAEKIATLKEQIKQAINKAFTPAEPGTERARRIARIEASETITIELAHREAIAEDNERDARDWSAFKAQVAVTKAAEVEAAHVEAIAEDIKRDLVKRYAYMEGKDPKPVDFYTLVQRIYNPETDKKTINAAQVEALAEEAERNATKCSAILEEIKADDRRNMRDMQPEAMKDTAAEVREQSDMEE